MQYWEIHVYQADDTAGCCTNSMHAIREWISKLGIFRFRAPAHGSSNRNAGAVLRFLSVEWWTEWVCACALRTRHAFMMWLCECARSSQANGVRMPSHGMDATEYGMCVRQLNEYTQHFNRQQCCTREMSVFKVFSDAVVFCLSSYIFYFYFLLFHAACFPRHLGANAFWWNGWCTQHCLLPCSMHYFGLVFPHLRLARPTDDNDGGGNSSGRQGDIRTKLNSPLKKPITYELIRVWSTPYHDPKMHSDAYTAHNYTLPVIFFIFVRLLFGRKEKLFVDTVWREAMDTNLGRNRVSTS